ncbi:hypothetical protein LINGRAHAP2_LOCUS4626, partial [Linum grandiflorum]
EHTEKCTHKKVHEGSRKILGSNYSLKGKTELSANQFIIEVSRKELIMILMHEYPLSIIEHPQPLFKVPTRNTVKKDILNLYGVQRSKIHRDIDSNKENYHNN